MTNDRRPLWSPSSQEFETTEMARFIHWLAAERGVRLAGYRDLWNWSVMDLEAFWESVWDFYEVKAHVPYTRVLSSRDIPNAKWFEGAQLNFAEHLVQAPPEKVAVIEANETENLRTLTYADLKLRVGAAQRALTDLGIGRGSVVAAYLPNDLSALVTFLAAAGLGAVWSCCAPEFGESAVLDRFGQLNPDLLLATGSYTYRGAVFDRAQVVRKLQGELRSLRATIASPGPLGRPVDGCLPWSVLERQESEPIFEPVPFDHPLWVLYSSGTTGRPKGIIHGHGGILLESIKQVRLHMDLGPSDRFTWYTTTGWMMWNVLVSALLSGGSIALYDGSPDYPDLLSLWRLVERAGLTYIGVGAGFVEASLKAGIRPLDRCNLSTLRTVGSTGSPLSDKGFEWLATAVKPGIPIASMSGGTDVCTSFISACRILPVYTGELQCIALGVDAAAYDQTGRPVIDQVGELVIRQPMPSMPLGFWNDSTKSKYRATYFSMFPGVWRHGDWIKISHDGSAVIYGRSDATLNRGGVRMGTSEFYAIVDHLPEVSDSLIVEVGNDATTTRLILFVVMADGMAITSDTRAVINATLKRELSPRHVPDEIYAVAAIPRTINGKKMEVPVRRILEGKSVSDVASTGSMANPAALDAFLQIRDKLR